MRPGRSHSTRKKPEHRPHRSNNCKMKRVPGVNDTSEQIRFATVATATDVHEILDLQAHNLPASLTPETMASQGFVTVRHDLSVLLRMNDAAPAVIAKADGRV